MKHLDLEKPKPMEWLRRTDRLAYMAVIGSAATSMSYGIFGHSQEIAAESPIWYLIAIPMLALAAYTVISGIAMRRKLKNLGDFGDAGRGDRQP